MGIRKKSWAMGAMDSNMEVSRLVDMLRKMQAANSWDDAMVQDLDGLILQIVDEYNAITERDLVIN
jgi:hypothetical protein